MDRKLRCQWRENRKAIDNTFVFSIGFRFGYWPCLKAPFIQFHLLFWVFEVWYGSVSYKNH